MMAHRSNWTLLALLGNIMIILTLDVKDGGVATYCSYSKQDTIKFSQLNRESEDEGEEGTLMAIELFDRNSTALCPTGSDYCYALWQEDALNNTSILAQGCWDSSGEVDCGFQECVSKKRPPKALNYTKFCCCLGDMCNKNVSDAYVFSEESEVVLPALQFVEQASYKTELVFIVLACLGSLIIMSTVGILIVRLWSTLRKPHPDSMHLMEAQSPNSPKFDADALLVQEVVGRGRFGSVCRAQLSDHTVAVKIFVVQHRQYFINERDIYTLPHMDHPCLPDYIGSDVRTSVDGRPEYMLVLSFAPLGCLQEHLRHNTLDWATLCKISQSLTKGLAHLHTEIKKGDKIKPCVAHRDLNSRNVLIKADGSCELCDFGFAIRISGSKYYQNGEELVAETTSLADVGTLRYMAPEVLEGAVNLRDCETSLKQIDVYALGLVLWEIATRCSDLYQGMEVPPFRLPFEAEIGLHPSIEQMQVLVTRNKARPLFPDIWKASNPAIRSLKETIDDCWDQDAEARLTALCVEERIIELPLLWERYKAGNAVPGVSPTVNINATSQYNIRPTNLCNLSSNQVQQQHNLNGFIMLDNSENKTSSSSYNRSDPCSSVSESTADTTLTMSPLLENNNYSLVSTAKNNANQNPLVSSFPKFSVPLQPHQGRNPCMERNLMSSQSEDVSVEGNNLLQKSRKKEQPDMRFLLDDDVFDGADNIERVAILTTVPTTVGVGGVRVSNPPIPYVQNAVHTRQSVMPKQPNLPGNGKHHKPKTTREGGTTTPPGPPQATKKKFSFFNSPKNVESSASSRRFSFGFKSFLERRKNKCDTGSSGGEDEQPLKYSPVSDKPNSPTEILNSPEIDEEEEENVVTVYSCHGNSNLNIGTNDKAYEKLNPVITKVVCVLDGKGCNGTTREMVVSRSLGHLDIDDAPSSAISRPKNETFIKDINDNNNSNKSPRPCSLKMKTTEEVEKEVAENSLTSTDLLSRKNSSGESGCSAASGEKIIRRVKTPYELKKGRFSLYNDRIMSASNSDSNEEGRLNERQTIWQSMPFEMNLADDTTRTADESC